MTTSELNAETKAINDARALLASLIAGVLLDAHIVSSGTEIFIARQDGRSNPMRIAASSPQHQITKVAQSTEINAPHVSNLVDVLAVGQAVSAGDWVATIRVLGDALTLTAPSSGRVAEIYAVKGVLLEYGNRILSIAGDEGGRAAQSAQGVGGGYSVVS